MVASDHLGQQFYHGSPVAFRPGDQITSATSRGSVGANHDYMGSNQFHDQSFFSSDPNQASMFDGTTGWSDTPDPKQPGYVYNVKPTGAYEHDEGFGSEEDNTAFKSKAPLKVTGIHSISPPLDTRDLGLQRYTYSKLDTNRAPQEIRRDNSLGESSSQRIQNFYNQSIAPYKGVE